MSGFTFASRVQRSLPPLLLVALAAVFGAWLLMATPALAAQSVCADDCTYPTLEAAFAATPSGFLSVQSGTYTLPAGTYTDLPEIIIDGAVTIEGVSRDETILQGNTQGVVVVQPGHSLTLRNLTIKDGASNTDGGAISAQGDELTVEDVHFVSNEASNGGAIYSTGALIVRDTTFESNTASSRGGAIYQAGGSLTIERATFDGNTADTAASAVFSSVEADIDESLFADDQALRIAGGTISHSAFLGGSTATAALVYTPSPLVDASDNWWGSVAGPAAAAIGSGVDASNWLERVTVAVDPVSPTVGEELSITAQVLNSDDETVEDVRLNVDVDGPHQDAAMVQDGNQFFYTGTVAGTDSISATVMFGDSSSETTVTPPLEEMAAVTWVAPAPPPPPEDDPIDLLTPWMDLLSEQEKADVLTETGLFPPGVIDPNDLSRAQTTSTPNDILRFEDASRISLGLPQSTFDPVGWWANSIPAAIASGLAGGDPFNISPLSGLMTFDFLEDVFLSYFEQLFANLEAALNGLFPASVNSEFPGMLGWGFLFDDAGAIADSILGAASIEDASVEEDPTLVSLEIAEGSLPADVRVEQITLARLDTEVGRWIPVESVVVPLEDGGFGLLAWLDQTGVFGVMMRPVAERTLHEGVTALVWFGAEGQPPSRAILGADAEIEALWVLDAGTWRSYRPGAPAFTQTLSALKNGQPIMVVSPGGGSWLLPSE